jgi:hypothetical protein
LNEFSFVEIGLYEVKGKVTGPTSVKGGYEHGGNPVDNKLPIDPHAKFAAPLLKFPRINAATRR